MNTNDNRLKAHKLIDHIFQDLLPAHGMAQRPEQIQLSHRMLDAMQDGRIALCDAGTGIGKTYAYLAAAAAASFSCCFSFFLLTLSVMPSGFCSRRSAR